MSTFIKRCREEAGLTQAQLAEKMDVHTRRWSDKAKEYGISDIRLCGRPEKNNEPRNDRN